MRRARLAVVLARVRDARRGRIRPRRPWSREGTVYELRPPVPVQAEVASPAPRRAAVVWRAVDRSAHRDRLQPTNWSKNSILTAATPPGSRSTAPGPSSTGAPSTFHRCRRHVFGDVRQGRRRTDAQLSAASGSFARVGCRRWVEVVGSDGPIDSSGSSSSPSRGRAPVRCRPSTPPRRSVPTSRA